MDKFTVKSTSSVSAKCNDMPLRETSSTRLVFRPMLIENKGNPEAGVKGSFVFQRKKPSETWEDADAAPLSSLKSGEGYKIELHTAELLQLFQELRDLYALKKEAGIPGGTSTFVRATLQLQQLANLSKQDLGKFLAANAAVGSTLLSSMLEWAISLDEPTPLVEQLVGLGSDALQKLNVAVGLQSLKKALEIWTSNSENFDEEFWQKSLAQYSFVLEQVFAWPTTVVKGKAYVGGKDITNTGGNIVDFLVKNQLTQNAALIEIKPPTTKLLGPEYRAGINNLSSELSGSVMQVLDYKHSLQEQYLNISHGQPDLFDSFNPQCAVIIGNAAAELSSPSKRKSFELFRHQLPGVSIFTYDELFAKTEQLIHLLEGKSIPQEPDLDEDIPF